MDIPADDGANANLIGGLNKTHTHHTCRFRISIIHTTLQVIA